MKLTKNPHVSPSEVLPDPLEIESDAEALFCAHAAEWQHQITKGGYMPFCLNTFLQYIYALS